MVRDDHRVLKAWCWYLLVDVTENILFNNICFYIVLTCFEEKGRYDSGSSVCVMFRTLLGVR
jgi:hypothetical protein